jgi:glycosyltransferase involved in cell wall biosynthesis
MRVGIEAQRLFRKKKHGMDIVALELIRNLHTVRTQIEFVVFVKQGDDNTCLNGVAGVKVVILPNAPYPIWEQLILPWAVKKYKVDLLHCTANTAPLFLSVPFLVTLHDIIYLENKTGQSSSFYQRFGNYYRAWLVPKIVKKAVAIVTVSHFEKKNIDTYFNFKADFVKCIYNGVGAHFKKINDTKQLAACSVQYNLPDKFIFFIGNTDPKKNVIGVLKALHLLKKSGQLQYKLVMPDINIQYIQSLLVTIGAQDIMQDIHILPYVPNAELPAILNKASIFLYPSLRESFGIPLLEAMKCGVPVIASNTSSMPEVAADAALYVNPLDSNSIAKAIVELSINKPLSIQLVEKGLARSQFFSWQHNATETSQLYQTILTNSHKRLKQ